MNKFISALALLFAPVLVFSQAQLVINGTSYVTIVENGGSRATPIYIDIANSATDAITTSGSKGWIISENEYNMVKWDIKTSTGTYTVPFGYDTSYSLPFTFTISTGGTGSGSILFSTYHTIADQYTGVKSSTGDPSDVTNMNPWVFPGSPSNTDNSYNAVDRFWIIDASKFAYTTKPTLSSMVFSYMHAGTAPEFASPNNSSDENDLVAQRFDSSGGATWGDWLGSGTWAASGNIGTVTNTFSLSPANFFRSWTLANSVSPLPIELSSFTVQCNNDSALIQWTSQTELNNDYYTVEKTTDNVHFQTVAILRGAGTTSLPTNYSITDHTPFTGDSYYLLFQTDYDGKKTQSGNPVLFSGCGSTPVTTINAYDATTHIEVNINAVKPDNFTISLVNMYGQIVYSGNHPVVLGHNEIKLPNNVATGVYILTVGSDAVNYSQKMLLGVR